MQVYQLEYRHRHLIRIYDSFQGRVTVKLFMKDDDVIPVIEPDGFTGSEPPTIEANRPPFAAGSLPREEPAPQFGEDELGEKWYTTVMHCTDGSLIVYHKCIGKYRKDYTGRRRHGESNPSIVPAAWVNAVIDARQGRTVHVMIDSWK